MRPTIRPDSRHHLLGRLIKIVAYQHADAIGPISSDSCVIDSKRAATFGAANRVPAYIRVDAVASATPGCGRIELHCRFAMLSQP